MRFAPATLLLVLLSIPALGQAPQPSPVPRPSLPTVPAVPAISASSGVASLGPWWRDSELAEEIDLDESTVDALERLFLDHRLRLAKMASELDAARAAVDYERHRAPSDAEALRVAEDELFDVRARMEAARAELLVEVRALLTAEQWSQLSEVEHRYRLIAPEAPRAPRAPRPPRPLSSALPRPEMPPRPETPPRPDAPVAAVPDVPSAPMAPVAPSAPLASRPDRPAIPAPPAPPVAPLAPLPPAPPALSWWTDASIRGDLELKPEQMRALETEATEAAPRLRELQRQVATAEAALTRLVSAEDLDRDAARNQVDQLSSARRALLEAGRSLERRLLDVLTPEQRRRLDSL